MIRIHKAFDVSTPTNGLMIGKLELPTLVVQEGGYKTLTPGVNARHFFNGPWSVMTASKPARFEAD